MNGVYKISRHMHVRVVVLAAILVCLAFFAFVHQGSAPADTSTTKYTDESSWEGLFSDTSSEAAAAGRVTTTTTLTYASTSLRGANALRDDAVAGAALHPPAMAGGLADQPGLQPSGGQGVPRCAEPELLAITCTTNEPLSRLLPWIRYNQLIGFRLFYLFVEGGAAEPDVVQALRGLVGVKVFERNDMLAWWHRQSRAHHEVWLRKFFGQPCNGELFVKQSLNMEVAVHQARIDGASWIAHIDTDELIYPAGSVNYSMHEILAPIEPQYTEVILPNYEALPEHEHVVDPMLEVSLFKVAVDHTDKHHFQAHYRDVAHGNPNYFIAYSNGKSIARVNSGLRPHGAHRWASYRAHVTSFSHPQASVLHYTYNRFSDLVGRRDRCDCAPTINDAKRCFWLSFDQQAFIAASLKTEPELRRMFRERIVWDNVTKIVELRKNGLVDRIHTPQLLLHQLQSGLINSPERRSSRVVDRDVRWREDVAAAGPLEYFADFYHNRSCGFFEDMDTSLNVLERLGPVPGEHDRRDSDAVLLAQMRSGGNPGLQASGGLSTEDT